MCVCLQYIFKAPFWAVDKSWRRTFTLPAEPEKQSLLPLSGGEEGASWGQRRMWTPFFFNAGVGPPHLGQHTHQVNHEKKCQAARGKAEI